MTFAAAFAFRACATSAAFTPRSSRSARTLAGKSTFSGAGRPAAPTGLAGLTGWVRVGASRRVGGRCSAGTS